MKINPLSVLVADDDYFMQQLIVALLKQAGHSGIIVGNGRQVIDCLMQREFDVLLLDVMMPEMDGLEALAAIRHQEQLSGKHQPIIMVTGHAEVDDAARFQRAGADGYVTKPIDVARLHDELERVLGHYQSLHSAIL